jgi:hypothetical protein
METTLGLKSLLDDSVLMIKGCNAAEGRRSCLGNRSWFPDIAIAPEHLADTEVNFTKPRYQ